MKTSRIVIGILSIILFVFITFQSCVAGIGNSLEENGDVSGSAGLVLAICMLVAGIIAIAARASKKGSIVAGCFYAFGGLIGSFNVGTYKDLMIWSILAFIFAIVFIATGIAQKEDKIE